MTGSDVFSSMKALLFRWKFHNFKFTRKYSIDDNSELVQAMARSWMGDKSSPAEICFGYYHGAYICEITKIAYGDISRKLQIWLVLSAHIYALAPFESGQNTLLHARKREIIS